MNLEDVKVGQKVQIVGDCWFSSSYFGKVGTVAFVEPEDYRGKLSVRVDFEEFDDAGDLIFDWGNHEELDLLKGELEADITIRNTDNIDWTDATYISKTIENNEYISIAPEHLPVEFISSEGDVLARESVRDKLDQIERLVDQIRNQLGF